MILRLLSAFSISVSVGQKHLLIADLPHGISTLTLYQNKRKEMKGNGDTKTIK